jgi:hypothetical protein
MPGVATRLAITMASTTSTAARSRATMAKGKSKSGQTASILGRMLSNAQNAATNIGPYCNGDDYDEPARYGPDLVELAGVSLRRNRGYLDIARQALQVETLPEGALPIYEHSTPTVG